MTDNVVKKLQTGLAQDLVKFEHKANHDALSKEDLKLISETYQTIYQTLHDINTSNQLSKPA